MPNYKLKKGSVQWKFNQSRMPIQMFGGAFANGKTTALVIKALQLAKDYPGSNGLLARATYPKLNDTLRKVFFLWCPKHWIKKMPTQEDNTCYLTNGTVVNFRYVAQKGKNREDGSTTSNLLSATYDWIGVDQVEDPEISHKDILDLMGRLRGQTPYRPEGEEDPSMPSTGPRFLMLTANPSPNWVYKEIVQPVHIWQASGRKTEKLLLDESTGLPIVDLFESDTYANKANLPEDYLRNLETMYKGQQRVRFLEGKWAAFEGLIYGDFERSRHMITRDQALEHLANCLKRHVRLQVIESYDFGLVKPTCYLIGVVDDWGRVIIIDGFYQPNFHYTLHPQEIFELRERYAHYGFKFDERIRADPAIFKKSVIAGKKDTGDTIAKLLSDEGVYTRPASNDIIAGIAKVNAYLNGRADMPHIITGELNGPMLYVVDDLEFFEDEIGAYYWKRTNLGVTMDEPMDNAEDHAMDATKYMLAHLPHPSKVVVPSKYIKPPWMFWQEEEMRA